MDTCGLTDEQHKRTVGPSNSEYIWDDVVDVLMIELDQLCDSRATPATTGSTLNTRTRAFHAEQTGDDDDLAEDDDWREPDETEEVLQADVEEMQRAMEVVELSDMQDGEVEVMTVEMQQLGAMTSRWSQKRRVVAQEKTNRRFVQDAAKVDFV